MRLLITCFLFIFSALDLSAQDSTSVKTDTSWTSNGMFNFTFGQTSFTNWSAGGENSINMNILVLYNINYKKDNVSWENGIEMEYGTIVTNITKFKKTSDRFYFASKYGLKASKKWYYSYYLSLRSQFDNGFNYPNDSVAISSFMSPAYFMAGLGGDYFPVKTISVLLSPITYKLTMVNNPSLANSGSFGMTPAVRDSSGNVIQSGSRFKNEPGGFIKIYYQEEFKKKFSIKSKLELFASYVSKDQSVDVNWNTFFAMKVTKYISTTLTLDLIYDEDAVIMKEDENGNKVQVGPRTQFREVFGIGIAFKF